MIKYVNMILIFIGLLFSQDTIADKEQTISLHADDAPLAIVLSMLAEESGYNIVTGPNVNEQDKLSIHLDEVAVSEAINLIIRASGLSYEIIGNSILVAKQDKIMEDVGVKPHVISLQYANTDDVVKLLANISNQITVEKSGNNLLINASPKKIAEIEEIIAVIDVPATQIVLEARLIEVSMGDEEKVGLDWAKLSGVSFKVSEAGAPVDLGTKFSKSLIPGLTFTQNELGLYEESYTEVMKSILPEEMYYQRVWDADQESPIKGLIPFGYGAARQLTAFDLALDFLLKDNKAQILANSQVVTLNGHQATISMVDVVPYVLSSGGVGGQVKVQKEEVGIKLTILPTINDDGYITTSVTPEVSSIYDMIGPERNIPHVKKRISNTTVRVLDGETIVIAGLLSANKRKQVSYMPVFGRLLGWIPYLGNLFKHNSEVILKTDLIVQITPRIITEGDSGIKQNLYHKLTEEQLMKFNIDEKALKGLEQMEERVEDILK
ncbi:MAG: hypothetical protein CMG24_00495 [Candidatus Marinimicrobia bacterium]|nr:hypothetical protein [Candidatus Neomarinimicrobiota bacterium]